MENKLGKRLVVAREKMKLSQIEVKKRTGINNKTLSGYERGVSEPDLETLKTLASVYEVPLAWITDHKEDGNQPQPLDLSLSDQDIMSQFDFMVDGVKIGEEDMKRFLNFIRFERDLKRSNL